MVTDSQLLLAADHAKNDVSYSQMMDVEEEQEEMDWCKDEEMDCDDLLRQALDDEDVSDSQMMDVEEEQEEMDWGQDELLCQAPDEEMKRQREQNMYGGGVPAQLSQAGAPLAKPPVRAPAAPAQQPQAPTAQPPQLSLAQPPQVPPTQPLHAPPAPPPQGPAQPLQAPPVQPPAQQAALNDTARRVTFYPVNQLDILQSMNELEFRVTDMLQHEMERHQGIKWYMALTAEYSRLNLDGEQITTEQVFRSDTDAVLNDHDITNTLASAMQEIYRRSQEFQAEGSGWALERVILLTLHTVAYQPLMGNSYIKLPDYIMKKKAVLNIKNQDDKCILWSILAHLHPISRDNNPNRVAKYRPYEHELNMIGVAYPTPLQDICKIEKNNNLSINVIGYDSTDGFYPLRITRDIKDQHINLLLIKDSEKSHYCLIRNFSRLMSHRTAHKGTQYFCYNCLHAFTTQRRLDKHMPLCYQQRAQKIVFPDKEKTVKFKNIKNS